jgi:hypothetical protein
MNAKVQFWTTSIRLSDSGSFLLVETVPQYNRSSHSRHRIHRSMKRRISGQNPFIAPNPGLPEEKQLITPCDVNFGRKPVRFEQLLTGFLEMMGCVSDDDFLVRSRRRLLEQFNQLRRDEATQRAQV